MYHMVSTALKTSRFKGLRVAPDAFEQQIRFLHDNGWQFVTMSELIAHGSTPPTKCVAITFDDGYEDNLTNALPVLERYNAKATIYLVWDRHDRDWSVSRKSHHDSGELKHERKLSDDQMHQLLASGLIELGAHTLSHPNLRQLPPEQRRVEIQQCRTALEAHFNTPVASFAYPFGIYTQDDVQLVSEAGYTSAVTVAEGIPNPTTDSALELPRIKVSGKDSFPEFRLKVRRGFRGVRS